MDYISVTSKLAVKFSLHDAIDKSLIPEPFFFSVFLPPFLSFFVKISILFWIFILQIHVTDLQGQRGSTSLKKVGKRRLVNEHIN